MIVFLEYHLACTMLARSYGRVLLTQSLFTQKYHRFISVAKVQDCIASRTSMIEREHGRTALSADAFPTKLTWGKIASMYESMARSKKG